MALLHHLGLYDYIVVGFCLLLFLGIGFITKYYGGQRNATEYLLAGKNMPKLPVIFSVIATLASPISMLGSPAEVYKYGLRIACYTFLNPVAIFLASFVFTPVYYQCGVATVNEFLVMRYGKIIRYITSSLFVIQMIFLMAIILYSSVLAASSVTDLSMTTSIITLGAVCTLYCFLGGLKAVLWTDTLQGVFMIVTILSMYIAGIYDAGGISKLWKTAKEGQRLDNILDFHLDFTQRYSLWGTAIRGFINQFAYYGTSQLEMQRVLSMRDTKRAKSVLQLSAIPYLVVSFVFSFFGIILYAIYSECDPISNKDVSGIVKHDQLVPAYIVSRFGSIPGMTGLCITGIFSASLSTFSSALNSASTVTVMDLIKPLYNKGQMSDTQTVWLAKTISLVYGVIGMGFSFLFLQTSSVKILSITLLNIGEGPLLALFCVGVLSRKADDKSVSISLVLSLIIMAWISFGSLFSRYNEPPLPMKTSGCPIQNFTTSFNTSASIDGTVCQSTPMAVKHLPKEPFILYKVSFTWFTLIGLIVTLLFILISILITGCRKNVIPADSKCLSPVTRFWMKTKTQHEIEM